MKMGNLEKKMLHIEVYKRRHWNHEIREHA